MKSILIPMNLIKTEQYQSIFRKSSVISAGYVFAIWFSLQLLEGSGNEWLILCCYFHSLSYLMDNCSEMNNIFCKSNNRLKIELKFSYSGVHLKSIITLYLFVRVIIHNPLRPPPNINKSKHLCMVCPLTL